MPTTPPPFYAYPWISSPPQHNFTETKEPAKYPIYELLKLAPKELETKVASLIEPALRAMETQVRAPEPSTPPSKEQEQPQVVTPTKKVAFSEVTELIGPKDDGKSVETTMKKADATDKKVDATEKEVDTTENKTDTAVMAKVEQSEPEWDYKKDPLWHPGEETIAEMPVVPVKPPAPTVEDKGAEGAEIDGAKTKKKKSSKFNADGTKKVKKPAPTGFEEYYADAPITPAEFKEEREEIYNHTRPFSERIEACIGRYKLKRKLNSERGNYLLKFLTLGGVDSTIKQFQGDGKGAKKKKEPYDLSDDESDMEDSGGPTIYNVINPVTGTPFYEPIFDNSQKAISKYYNPNAPQNWEVDWVGVASCFLSLRAPYLWGIWRPEVVDGYCEVVINFLNYVMMHGVCPEYTKEILAARRVAQKAKVELKDIDHIYKRVPGQFHHAMQVVCNSDEFGLSTLAAEEDDLYVAGDKDALERAAEPGYRTTKLTPAHAEAAVRTTITLLGTPSQKRLLSSWTPGTTLPFTAPYTAGFEIVDIILPDEDQLHAFSMAAYHAGKIEGLIEPQGILVVKPWINPNNTLLPSLPDEYPAERKARRRSERQAAKEHAAAIAAGTYVPPPSPPTSQLFMDFAILKHFHVGMKLEGSIAHAKLGDAIGDDIGGDIGEGEIRFIESLCVQASFFQPILNERMEFWRDPVETERDPPKCTDAEGDGMEEGGDDCQVDD